MRVWPLAVAALGVAVYSVASLQLMVHWPAHPWTVVALFGPLLAAVAFTGATQRHLPTLAVCAMIAAVLAVVVQRGGVADVSRLYVLQHGVIHALLAWSFGITLRAGSVPLITRLAERVHTDLTPPMRAYSRKVTVAWVAYFAAMVVVSLGLYLVAPWSWWSFFCTIVTPLAAVLLFIGEHLWRHWAHPDFEPASLARAWQAYRQQAAADRS